MFSLLSCPLCVCVWCLLPNWNVSCLLPPSHLHPRHRRLAPRHQHTSASPIPLSLESQGVLRHTKRKVNLQACTAKRRVAISLLGKKKISFFVVFLLITALCNIRKHTGTPKVLLTPFFSCNMSWGEEKKLKLRLLPTKQQIKIGLQCTTQYPSHLEALQNKPFPSEAIIKLSTSTPYRIF